MATKAQLQHQLRADEAAFLRLHAEKNMTEKALGVSRAAERELQLALKRSEDAREALLRTGMSDVESLKRTIALKSECIDAAEHQVSLLTYERDYLRRALLTALGAKSEVGS